MTTTLLIKTSSPTVESVCDWHPSQVKSALNMKGWTLASLAEHYGLCNGSGISKALVGSFPLGEKRIADALEMHPKDIWPSRYEKDGTRKLVGFHAIQSTRRRNSVNNKLAAMNNRENE